MRDETIDERPRHEQSLRYLKANDVKGPLRSFEGLEVLDREHQTIGRLDGIIIDPQERRVRYLVVDERKFVRRHRVLLPLETARVDAARAALHVDVDKADVDDMEEFDTCTFPPFSDDDLITALFAR